MLRRTCAVLAFALFPATIAMTHGCGSSEPAFESLCDFLGNTTNCERTFIEDVGDRCGAVGEGNGPTGEFQSRSMLDNCLLDEGGIVTFNPPLDVTMFPVVGPVNMTFTDPLGNECGTAMFGGLNNFSITIDSEPPDAGAVPNVGGGGAGGTSGAGGGDAGTCPTFDVGSASSGNTDPENSATTICGGTFSALGTDGRSTIDVTCASGESHHFNALEIEKCEQYQNVMPTAEFDSKAGGVNTPGSVSFRIFYPPVKGALENAKPTVVEYFNCQIPPAPDSCNNGVKDINETDIDCGGTKCPPCAEGMGCLNDSDCLSGSCIVIMGMKTCGAGSSTSSGGGASTTSSSSSTGGAGGASSSSSSSSSSAGGAASSSSSA